MARVTPEEYREKLIRRAKASLDDVKRGVERVEEAPGAKAAAKQDKMKQKLMEALDSGRWAERVSKVSKEEWQQKMLEKGVPRITSGLDAAASKIEDFAAQLLPAVDRAKAKVDKMPDVTLEDSVNRMTTFVREMAKFKKK